MNIGVLGGTFDPPHDAHLRIAERSIDQFTLDKVIFIPSGNPWQKKEATPYRHRYEMTKILIGDSNDFAHNVERAWNTDSIFTQEGVLDYTYIGTFDFYDKPWDPDQIKIIAIIQDKATKEIYQSSQINTHTFDFLNVENSGTSGLHNIPLSFALHQNYPNPFNPLTSIQYDLPSTGMVDISVYNMIGRKVKTLVNGIQNPGFKTILEISYTVSR